jgi:uncharacterized cupin superfamily protein
MAASGNGGTGAAAVARIVSFDDPAPAPEASVPPAERVVAGDPRQQTWNHYSDPTGQFHAGTWQGEPGAWRVFYDAHEEELCTLLEGTVRLTDAAGQQREFSAGAIFVVPGGFTGIWENVTRVRKVYAIGTLRTPDAMDAQPR